jgi:two-component system NtrC family sensor kinase
MGFLATIFSSNFMPHGHCFFWKADILWSHVVADITIALAYFSISSTLSIVLWKNRELPIRWVLRLFAAFIFCCGMTHVLDIIVLWQPIYYLQAIVKIVTATVSIVTAILILPIIPRFLKTTKSG